MTLGTCRCLILLALTISITLSLAAEQTIDSLLNQEIWNPSIEKSQHRFRRQAGFQNWQIDPNRQVWINNAFQIPIQTLQAISNLLQSTRPLVGTRPMAPMATTAAASSMQYQQYPNYPQNAYSQQYTSYQQNSQGPKRKARKRPTIAAQVTGLDKNAEDGSSFKI